MMEHNKAAKHHEAAGNTDAAASHRMAASAHEAAAAAHGIERFKRLGRPVRYMRNVADWFVN